MKIKDVKEALPISGLKVEKDHFYFFIGNSRAEQMSKMRALGVPQSQARNLVFMNSLQGLSKWSLMVFDGYDPHQLATALQYRPKQVFNALECDDDTGTVDGNPSTPLEKAVLHLLKIGSTNRDELALMSKQFITEKGACEKLNVNYWLYSKEKIKDLINKMRLLGVEKIVLLITEDFFTKSDFTSLQLFGAYFNCVVKIDNSVEDYKLTGEENVSVQKH